MLDACARSTPLVSTSRADLAGRTSLQRAPLLEAPRPWAAAHRPAAQDDPDHLPSAPGRYHRRAGDDRLPRSRHDRHSSAKPAITVTSSRPVDQRPGADSPRNAAPPVFTITVGRADPPLAARSSSQITDEGGRTSARSLAPTALRRSTNDAFGHLDAARPRRATRRPEGELPRVATLPPVHTGYRVYSGSCVASGSPGGVQDRSGDGARRCDRGSTLSDVGEEIASRSAGASGSAGDPALSSCCDGGRPRPADATCTTRPEDALTFGASLIDCRDSGCTRHQRAADEWSS